ncbi:MAG: DUF3343 domain-containing protein [Eggerthellaceae bacterium]|nr:DUF3343 domain-containing protein [Eggerthellaceae bacterium]
MDEEMQKAQNSPDAVFYILVNSATEGFALYNFLHGKGCAIKIAPASRQVTMCCGMSIRVDPADMPGVNKTLSNAGCPAYDRIVELRFAFNARRDSYC